MTTPLLQTKLFIPQPRSGLVQRHRIVDKMNEGLERRLTLVSAPAGFGKSTMLIEWAMTTSKEVTWLSIDHVHPNMRLVIASRVDPPIPLTRLRARDQADKMEVRKRYESLCWAGALIWAGLVFGADNLGILPQFGQADAWTWIFVGVGLYGTLMNIYGTVSPDLFITTTGDYLWSGFWLLIGLSGFFVVDVFWPVALVLIGVAIVAKQLVRQNSSKLFG